MTSEPALPAESGAGSDTVGSTGGVIRQRADTDRLRDLTATSAILERAKGAVMALAGCSAEAAHQELLGRARAADRTLIEECWITLGAFGAPAPPPARGFPPPGASPTVPLSRAPGGDASDDLARLGAALSGVASPQELARRLLEHLARTVAADAVMVFGRLPSGGLELLGHAGIGDVLADQWQRVPPLDGLAPLEALTTGQACWVEDIDRERRRPLIGDPPERWQSRAWLPVPNGNAAEGVVGVLRSRPGPFTARAREHLRAVVRRCAGRLRAPEARTASVGDDAAGAVRAVFDALPGSALLLTPLRGPSGDVEDFRVDAATPDAAAADGRTGRELLGARVLHCWPPLADGPLWRRCLDVLDTGRPYEGEPFAGQEPADGSAEPSVRSVRVTRLGAGLVVGWTRHDPAERQEQRLADVQRLGNLGWASWDLVTGEAAWAAQVFTVLGRDPEAAPVPLGDLPGLALSEDRPALARALGELERAGTPAAVPFRIETRDGVRHLRIVAEAVTGPHGTPVEVHGFLQDLTAQRSAELALVESERAMLAQHGVLQAERELAGRLQHALLPLPSEPLRPAGLRVEVAYLPAQSGIHVGGDWFSAIELADGSALFVVGDVAGHGIDAVATMAQLRFTAKGMVSTGSSLTGALSRLNTLLLHSRDAHGTATMVLALYRPDERRLVWAQAGHPPPVLLRAGQVRRLERPRGMLLGACAAPPYEEAECLLEPGDRLLLYTDGLVERPGEGLDLGLERLARAMGAEHTDEPGSLAPLLDAMLEGELRDDVCVVDVRVPREADVAHR
ncbi:SpoIIE family protein phosphatase [Streptomyces sp. NPDC006610]|uniref:SpoIIE family protein phosphatase n=1 Tax=Streptomyces sp. NPDC006610 TaxID=3154584 RepID=UPI0033A9D3AF